MTSQTTEGARIVFPQERGAAGDAAAGTAANARDTKRGSLTFERLEILDNRVIIPLRWFQWSYLPSQRTCVATAQRRAGPAAALAAALSKATSARRGNSTEAVESGRTWMTQRRDQEIPRKPKERADRGWPRAVVAATAREEERGHNGKDSGVDVAQHHGSSEAGSGCAEEEAVVDRGDYETKGGVEIGGLDANERSHATGQTNTPLTFVNPITAGRCRLRGPGQVTSFDYFPCPARFGFDSQGGVTRRN